MAKKQSKAASAPLSSLLRVPPGPVSMADLDPAAVPGFPGRDKDDAPARMLAMTPELSDLQERLYAHGRSDPEHARSVLVVLQGMDTSGKGGVIRHAIGLVDPQGVQLKSFKAPTAEERAQHYLWRIRKALPSGGMIGIFDRSHYEDVLVVRVDELVPRTVWERRYDEINAFERELVTDGLTIVKVALVISPDEQAERLRERIERPDKHWKYNPSDLDVRAKWAAYREAYQAVFDRTSTEAAPWYAVPADNKWYARLAVAELLARALEGLDLGWPEKDFDTATELARLAAVDPS